MKFMNTDEQYMARALQIAALGYGRVSPNPMVGAVVVADGRVIGEGYHRQWGHAHAEVNAIASVSDADRHLLSQSTIYVTLEPCSHYGKTPPCSKLIIETGIPRVVVGCMDPFKEVSGRGVKMLREAGVEVTTCVLENECRQLNRKFITAHTEGRPYVLLKWAESADGFMSTGNGAQTHISTPATQTVMHRLRAGYDAIMVGANTVRTDNPSLTTRLWHGRSPMRVVMSHDGCRDLADRKVFTDGNPTLLYSTSGKTLGQHGENVEEAQLPASLADVARDLYRRGITSLMVEGGPTLLQSFFDADLWDEVRIEHGDNPLGSGKAAPCAPRGEMCVYEEDNHQIINILR